MALEPSGLVLKKKKMPAGTLRKIYHQLGLTNAEVLQADGVSLGPVLGESFTIESINIPYEIMSDSKDATLTTGNVTP